MKNFLFVCSQNWLLSPTAEDVFATWLGIVAASGGLNHDAATTVTPELVQWSDIIFVMEKILCRDIPDDYGFMDPTLVEILKARVPKFLR